MTDDVQSPSRRGRCGNWRDVRRKAGGAEIMCNQCDQLKAIAEAARQHDHAFSYLIELARYGGPVPLPPQIIEEMHGRVCRDLERLESLRLKLAELL